MENMESGIYEEKLKQESAVPVQQWSVPQFDAAEFRPFVDKYDITDEEKDELLRVLWNIAVACVDLGFGVDSVQRILPRLEEISSPEESNGLKEIMPTSQFNTLATDQANSEKDSA